MARSRLPVACALAVAAMLLAGCGEKVIELSQSDPNYDGAVLFDENCAGCHTIDAAGSKGSSTKVTSKEYKDGPNFNERKETKEDVLYAIRNGGFSSGPMPQNIVTGDDAEKVADFVAKYSGSDVSRPASPSSK
jgi:mono/diheme cytochrome c family protein